MSSIDRTSSATGSGARPRAIAEFLASLDLQVTLAAPAPAIPRVAQLTFRTSQLNASTVRRTEAELSSLLAAGALEALSVTVTDRFGDYGLVGVVLFNATRDAVHADTFLLSCRVLQRGVEQRMVARLGEIALSRGLARVDIPFVPTAKNQPILHFLHEIGAREDDEGSGTTIFALDAGTTAKLTYDPDRTDSELPHADDRYQTSPSPERTSAFGLDADEFFAIAMGSPPAAAPPASTRHDRRARRRAAAPRAGRGWPRRSPAIPPHHWSRSTMISRRPRRPCGPAATAGQPGAGPGGRPQLDGAGPAPARPARSARARGRGLANDAYAGTGAAPPNSVATGGPAAWPTMSHSAASNGQYRSVWKLWSPGPGRAWQLPGAWPTKRSGVRLQPSIDGVGPSRSRSGPRRGSTGGAWRRTSGAALDRRWRGTASAERLPQLVEPDRGDLHVHPSCAAGTKPPGPAGQGLRRPWCPASARPGQTNRPRPTWSRIWIGVHQRTDERER